MRALIATLSVVVGTGCGNDVGLSPVDAAGVGGPPGSPLVTVTAPRLNESFYPTQSITVSWSATDDDTPITCDVSASGPATITIANGVTMTATAASTTWAIDGAPAGMYRISVACTDAGNLTGVGQSAVFRVSAPPQQVSYATQLQPIWSGTCATMPCHDSFMPTDGLNLTAAASYTQLQRVSGQCASYKLVEPGAPERSYLVFKLQGSGPCFMPSRMPKGATALTAEQLQLVRDWIYNGAPNN